MSRLSNKIMVSVLEDGRQIVANIMLAQGALSQSWNGTNAIPDFTVPANQPLLYLSIINNGVRDNMGVTGSWYYNNEEIPSAGTAKFQPTTYTVGTVVYPALRIVGNLASSSNTDVDTISYSGSLQREGDTIPIVANVLFNVIRAQTGSWFGVVSPGMSSLNAQDEYVDLTATLYDDKGAVQAAGSYVTKWTVDAPDYTPTTEQDDTTGLTHGFRITASEFTDYATVTCRFVVNNETKWTALAAVDDVADDLSIAITSVQGDTASISSATAYGEGSDAKIRQNQSVKFKAYVVNKNDPATNVTISEGFVSCFIKIYDYANTPSASTEINPLPIYGPTGDTTWRKMDTEGGGSYFTFTIDYNAVKTILKGSMTGVLLLSTEQDPWSNS